MLLIIFANDTFKKNERRVCIVSLHPFEEREESSRAAFPCWGGSRLRCFVHPVEIGGSLACSDSSAAMA